MLLFLIPFIKICIYGFLMISTWNTDQPHLYSSLRKLRLCSQSPRLIHSIYMNNEPTLNHPHAKSSCLLATSQQFYHKSIRRDFLCIHNAHHCPYILEIENNKKKKKKLNCDWCRGRNAREASKTYIHDRPERRSALRIISYVVTLTVFHLSLVLTFCILR